MKAWNVYLGGKKIDTVFTVQNMSATEITLSLINHDVYHPLIVVKQTKIFH